ncbi:hypothetical protein Holit_03102 [Hollandina sp. SP2]
MLYISILFFILFFSPITKKDESFIFTTVCYLCLLSISVFRFGIGTDYFNYYSIFYFVPESFSGISLQKFIISQIEPGFWAISILIKSLNLPFTYLIAFCSFISLSLIFYTIQKKSMQKTFSVFIFFANYYMVYIENTLRQGIAMGIFIYALYDFLQTKSFKKYCILILLGCTFHITIIVALCVPLIVRISLKTILNPIFLFCITLLSLVFSFVVPRLIVLVLSGLFPRYLSYARKTEINIMPLLLRLLELVLVYFLTKRTCHRLGQREIMCVKFFIFGCLFYFSLSSISVFSRLTEYFMFIEIILIPNLMFNLRPNENKLFKIFFSFLFLLLFFKDLNSFSYQGNFRSHRVIDYPYVTIFNKDAIKNIRPSKSYSRYFSEN